MGARLFLQPDAARHRAAGQVRGEPDHHQGADRQDPVPGFGRDRRPPQGLDAQMARDHGLAPIPWLLVAAPMAALPFLFALPHALLPPPSLSTSQAHKLPHELTLPNYPSLLSRPL